MLLIYAKWSIILEFVATAQTKMVLAYKSALPDPTCILFQQGLHIDLIHTKKRASDRAFIHVMCEMGYCYGPVTKNDKNRWIMHY